MLCSPLLTALMLLKLEQSYYWPFLLLLVASIDTAVVQDGA